LLLCYVGHHDSAYAWAERRRIAPGDMRLDTTEQSGPCDGLAFGEPGPHTLENRPQGPATNIDAERPPRERLLKDPLPEIASEEEAIRSACAQGGQESQFGDPDILRLAYIETCLFPQKRSIG
jgi:hypothetical protein